MKFVYDLTNRVFSVGQPCDNCGALDSGEQFELGAGAATFLKAKLPATSGEFEWEGRASFCEDCAPEAKSETEGESRDSMDTVPSSALGGDGSE